jgi:hypothetical protein
MKKLIQTLLSWSWVVSLSLASNLIKISICEADVEHSLVSLISSYVECTYNLCVYQESIIITYVSLNERKSTRRLKIAFSICNVPFSFIRFLIHAFASIERTVHARLQMGKKTDWQHSQHMENTSEFLLELESKLKVLFISLLHAYLHLWI